MSAFTSSPVILVSFFSVILNLLLGLPVCTFSDKQLFLWLIPSYFSLHSIWFSSVLYFSIHCSASFDLMWPFSWLLEIQESDLCYTMTILQNSLLDSVLSMFCAMLCVHGEMKSWWLLLSHFSDIVWLTWCFYISIQGYILLNVVSAMILFYLKSFSYIFIWHAEFSPKVQHRRFFPERTNAQTQT